MSRTGWVMRNALFEPIDQKYLLFHRTGIPLLSILRMKKYVIAKMFPLFGYLQKSNSTALLKFKFSRKNVSHRR